MINRTMLFHRVAIIGVGLIGGSLGQAIKKNRLAREVIGVSRRQNALTHALKCQAIDHSFHDVKRAVVGADLVVLATSVGNIKDTLALIGKDLRRGCILTDVGSTNLFIVEEA